jgi:hypothetical protein
MFLREFIYFDKSQQQDDDRYDPSSDTGVIKSTDLRKCRLTLKMLNKLRKAGDARTRERSQEADFVKKMYRVPDQTAGAI